MKRSERLLLCSLIVVLSMLLAQVAPVAAEGGSGTGEESVSPYYGSFGTDVPIVVSRYHGLEPDVKLAYNSTNGNGVAGVGWGLSAGSTIRRASPGGGAPRYTSSDLFYLDGQELVPDGSMGGHYATRIKNYARIVKDEGVNRWYVTGTNGNVATYEPSYTVASGFSGVYRWELARVQDPHGNAVNYDYWCDTGKDCYLDRITYNGTEVKFYYETRPDPISFGNGSHVGETRYRLKSVAVRVSGKLARAYTLSYATGGTERSLLANVQQCGRNANVDGSGNVSGGTCLPAMTFGYRPTEKGFYSQTWNATTAHHMYNGGGSTRDYQTFALDLNGDGKSDVATISARADGSWRDWIAVELSTGSGFSSQTWSSGTPGHMRNGGRDQTYFTVPGDFNGDGKQDLATISPNGGGAWDSWIAVDLSTGSGFSSQTWNSATPGHMRYGGGDKRYFVMPGDFNGDGKTDIATVSPNAEGSWNSWIAVDISTGSGFSTQYWATGTPAHMRNGGSGQNYIVVPGDFNGDGKTDVATVSPNGGGSWDSWIAVDISTGSGFSSEEWPTETPYYMRQGGGDKTYIVKAGDFNGDGRTDLATVSPNAGGGWGDWIAVDLSSGNDFTFHPWFSSTPAHMRSSGGQDYAIVPGDFDGDSLTDLVTVHRARSSVDGWRNWVAVDLSRGTRFVEEIWTATTANHMYNDLGDTNDYHVRGGDFNGDGKLDIATLHRTDSTQSGWYNWAAVELGRGSVPDLLTSMANGVGGSTYVGYTPSSAWSNTMMPPGLLVQTASSLTTCSGRDADGNGQSDCDTTNYSYQGGLWSWAERRFLGFRKVTAVLASDGSYTETYYWQKEGSISKPEVTYFRNNAGKIYSYSAYEYAENPAPPYTSNLIRRWDYECNLSSKCRRTLTEMSYDVYGNVVQTREWGDYDLAGDERTILRGYNPNTTKHITALPAYQNVYAGIGAGGTLLKQTLYVYDNNSNYNQPPTTGNLVKEQRWLNTTGAYVERRFTFDAWGNVATETDELGNVTRHTFDATYHVYETSTCNALNQCATQVWDTVLGQSTKVTDINGTGVHFIYDALGRKLSEWWPDKGDGIKTWSYLDWGNPNVQRVRVTEPDGTSDGLWVEFYQDGLGRVYKEVREGGGTVEKRFSGMSDRVWKETLPYESGHTIRWIVHTYDGAMRPRETYNPDGTKSEVVYGIDGNGKPYEVYYDELGNDRVVWKDTRDNVVQVREHDNGRYYYTTFDYDVNDKLVRVVNHAGNEIAMAFDSLGNKLAMSDPDLGDWTYTHDAAGNLLSRTDAKGQTTTYVYDALGRVTTLSSPDGTVRWYYDESGHGASLGRVTRKVYPGGSERYTYDAAGNTIETTRCVDGTCKTFASAYDALGRLASVTYPDGEVVSYGYNHKGQLETVSGYVNYIMYNTAGQIIQVRYANGTNNNYMYDGERKWLTDYNVFRGSTYLYNARFTYYANALVKSQSSTTNPLSHNLTYTYDGLYRLTGVSGGQNEGYAFDAVGNLLSGPAGSYGYGAGSAGPHAVTSAGGNSYTYDANGNMVSGAGRTMAWTANNMLASVTQDGVTTEYAYDGGEGRIKKVVGGSDVTRYFGKLYEEENGSGTKFYYAGDILVARQEGGTKEWFHSDRLGSVVMMTNVNGYKVKGYDYTPFGKFAGESGSADNDVTYTGHRYEAESGLIYMGARYYDAHLGRFISPDSVIPDPENPQAYNRYSYVYNNPVNNTDPSGHIPVVAAVVGVAIGAATGVLAGTMLTIAIIGAACTVAGYALKSPLLMSIGSVLTGYAGGGILGASVAGLTSPVSPLDPGIKQAIGWAYTAYGIIQSLSSSQSAQGDPSQQEQTAGHFKTKTEQSLHEMYCGSDPTCTIVADGNLNTVSDAGSYTPVDSNLAKYHELTADGFLQNRRWYDNSASASLYLTDVNGSIMIPVKNNFAGGWGLANAYAIFNQNGAGLNMYGMYGLRFTQGAAFTQGFSNGWNSCLNTIGVLNGVSTAWDLISNLAVDPITAGGPPSQNGQPVQLPNY